MCWRRCMKKVTSICLCVLPISFSYSMGVSVDPKRLVFSDQDRAKPITLINPTNETLTYRISFQEMRMTENGKLERLSKENLHDDYPASSSFIRYSPRQVIIPPKSSQIVRFMLRKPHGLEEGEYRSHVLFQALPKEDENLDLNQDQGASMNISLTPVYGVSIPLIVRHGQLQANVSFNNLQLFEEELEKTFVSLNIQQQGERSIFGRLTVAFREDGSRQMTIIGQLKGVSVYDVQHRKVKIPIAKSYFSRLKHQSGELIVRFEELGAEGHQLLAETITAHYGSY